MTVFKILESKMVNGFDIHRYHSDAVIGAVVLDRKYDC